MLDYLMVRREFLKDELASFRVMFKLKNLFGLIYDTKLYLIMIPKKLDITSTLFIIFFSNIYPANLFWYNVFFNC